MSQLFLSYASPDNAFALRLAKSLGLLGHAIWIDQWEIGVGEYLLGKITTGIAQAEYVIVLLSEYTMASSWVERELEMTYCEEIAQGRTIILPAVIAHCTIPLFLRPRRFIDFRLGYEIGVAQLATTLHMPSRHIAPFSRYAGTPSPEQLAFPPSLKEHSWYNGDMLKHAPRLSEISVEIGLPYIF